MVFYLIIVAITFSALMRAVMVLIKGIDKLIDKFF